MRTTPSQWSPPRLSPPSCKPGALPSSLSNHSAQPREAATQKKSLNQLSEEEGGRQRGENALETWLIEKKEKSDRILADCKVVTVTVLFLGWGEGEQTSFQGCSSWCETSWALSLRTGKDALLFFSQTEFNIVFNCFSKLYCQPCFTSNLPKFTLVNEKSGKVVCLIFL